MRKKVKSSGSSARRPKSAPLTVMVASTVYGFQTEIEQICAVLKGYGYEVWNSHLGTLPVGSNIENLDHCLRAVKDCDLFFGIIRPFYGTGIVGPFSITHQEFRKAVALKKPRWFVVHSHVTFARQLLKQFRVDGAGVPIPSFRFNATAVLDDVRVIDMYEDVTAPMSNRGKKQHYWAQEFGKLPDILTHLEAQFRNVDRIRTMCGK